MSESQRHSASTPVKNRRSIRLPEFDYSQEGMYYITICTADRFPLLGQLIGDRVELSAMGEIVRNEWRRTAHVRPNVSLHELVIMPDHLHAILTIIDRRGVLHTPVPQRLTSPSQTLGAIVKGFKGASTKRINEHRGTSDARVWQRNFYEHIIRDERDLLEIRDYIRTNPLRLSLKVQPIAASSGGVCNTPLRIRPL